MEMTDGLGLAEVYFCVEPPPWPWHEELEKVFPPHGEVGDETPPPPYLGYELPPPPPPPPPVVFEQDDDGLPRAGHCFIVLEDGEGVPLPPDPPPALVLGQVVDFAGSHPATHGSHDLPAPPCGAPGPGDACTERPRLDSGDTTAPVLSVIPGASALVSPEPPPADRASYVVHVRSDHPTPGVLFGRKGRAASFAMELSTEGPF